jgi:DNA-binding MarR family transcriptional regulator
MSAPAWGAPAPDQLADAYLAVIPQLMAFVRKNLNDDRQSNLRLGQFRMLHALCQNLGVTISEVASVLGVTLPSASKMADDLQRLGLLERCPDQQDRRRSILSLTQSGHDTYRRAVDSVRRQMAEKFVSLSPTERGVLFCAAIKLTELFTTAGTPSPAGQISSHDDVSPVAEHP